MNILIIFTALDLDLPVKESEDVRWTMKGEENDKYRVRLVALVNVFQN